MPITQKRMAVGLFGMSYREAYRHWNPKLPLQEIDYRRSIDNYREKLFAPFERLGYTIDVFFATDNHALVDTIASDYSSTAHVVFGARTRNGHLARNVHVKNVLQLIDAQQRSTDVTYDLVLITRFDLQWKIDVTDLPYQIDKFNVSMKCHVDTRVDDNLFIFAGCRVRPFLDFTMATLPWCFHDLRDRLQHTVGEIVYLHPGLNDTWNNPLFSFVRSPSILTTVHVPSVTRKHRIAVGVFGSYTAGYGDRVLAHLGIPASAYDLFCAVNATPDAGDAASMHSYVVVTGVAQQQISLLTLVDTVHKYNQCTYDTVVICAGDCDLLPTTACTWGRDNKCITVPSTAPETPIHERQMIVIRGGLMWDLAAAAQSPVHRARVQTLLSLG